MKIQSITDHNILQRLHGRTFIYIESETKMGKQVELTDEQITKSFTIITADKPAVKKEKPVFVPMKVEWDEPVAAAPAAAKQKTKNTNQQQGSLF